MGRRTAGDDARGPFARHPFLTLLGVNVAIALAVLAIGEVWLRYWVPGNLGYYTALSTTSSELVFPYGTIRMNSEGYPDDEFELGTAPRIGYFGDSVTYGVGAGHGHRFSERIENALPNYEHMNFALVGSSPTLEANESIVDLARRFDLDHVWFFFNLNDVLPTLRKNDSAMERTRWVQKVDQTFRGVSYTYTWLRNVVAERARRGSGTGMRPMPELHPRRFRPIFRETADRVSALGRKLAAEGVELTVILLPYEMQISQSAEDFYRDTGVQWEPGFIDRGAQRMLLKSLPPNLRVLDAYWAFVEEGAEDASRASNELGEYFVHDRGGRLDWNHPNRAGHRRIAEYVVAAGVVADSSLRPVTGYEKPRGAR